MPPNKTPNAEGTVSEQGWERRSERRVHLSEAAEILGVSKDAVRMRVKRGTLRSEKVLGLALREALQLGHSYIGTEHILLALVREPESIASESLLNLGVDPNKVREKVAELLTSAS
jgi:excisionase family DNA binding protein